MYVEWVWRVKLFHLKNFHVSHEYVFILTFFFSDWCNMVVGKLSEFYDCDSSNHNIRKLSEVVLLQEIMFATHLGLPAIMFKLHGTNHANLARIIYDKALLHNSNQVSLLKFF